MSLSNLTLKPNVNPTLFDVSIPTVRFVTNRKSVYKNTVMKTSNISSTTITTSGQSDACVSIIVNYVNDEIARLQKENTNFKNLIEEKESTLHYFLNDDEIEATKKAKGNNR